MSGHCFAGVFGDDNHPHESLCMQLSTVLTPESDQNLRLAAQCGVTTIYVNGSSTLHVLIWNFL